MKEYFSAAFECLTFEHNEPRFGRRSIREDDLRLDCAVAHFEGARVYLCKRVPRDKLAAQDRLLERAKVSLWTGLKNVQFTAG